MVSSVLETHLTGLNQQRGTDPSRRWPRGILAYGSVSMAGVTEDTAASVFIITDLRRSQRTYEGARVSHLIHFQISTTLGGLTLRKATFSRKPLQYA